LCHPVLKYNRAWLFFSRKATARNLWRNASCLNVCSKHPFV